MLLINISFIFIRKKFFQVILTNIYSKDKLPALRNVPRKKLLEETAKVDKVLGKFKTHSITKTNELFYAGAFVVTNRLGVKIDMVAGRKELMWKRWFQNKI